VSGPGLDRRRVIVVTESNLRNSHLNIRRHLDFFPRDCLGPPQRNGCELGKPIKIELNGLGEVIETDIGTSRTGAPRGHFRERKAFRRFFNHHRVKAGQQLALERLNGRQYRLSVDGANQYGRLRPTAAEFFSGIGLVRLALERQGWQVVLANDIDADKAEMYRHMRARQRQWAKGPTPDSPGRRQPKAWD
jgi:hypothetical protein